LLNVDWIYQPDKDVHRWVENPKDFTGWCCAWVFIENYSPVGFGGVRRNVGELKMVPSLWAACFIRRIYVRCPMETVW